MTPKIIRPPQIPVLSESQALERIRKAFSDGNQCGRPRRMEYIAQKVRVPISQCRELMTRQHGFVEREPGWFDFNPLVMELELSGESACS